MKIKGYQYLVNNLFPHIVGYLYNSIKFEELGYVISYSPGIGFCFRDVNIERIVTVDELFKFYRSQLVDMLCIYVERRFMDQDRMYETYIQNAGKTFTVSLVDRSRGIIELADLSLDSWKIKPDYPVSIGVINFLGIISSYMDPNREK